MQLSLKTSFEQNIQEFQVEKSTDGANFNEIGIVAAANIANGTAYSFTGKNAGREFYITGSTKWILIKGMNMAMWFN